MEQEELRAVLKRVLERLESYEMAGCLDARDWAAIRAARAVLKRKE